MPNMFDIADDILTAWLNDRDKDHNPTLDKILRICRQANLKPNKDKCSFWFTGIPFLGELISQPGMSLDLSIVQGLTTKPPPNCEKELQSFLGIVIHLSKLLPKTDEVSESLRKLTSVKTQLAWNDMYEDLYDKVKNIAKQDAYMKFYDAAKSLYLKTDASGISLEAGLLQVKDGMNCGEDEVLTNTALFPIAFTSKSLSSVKWHYSNME